MQRFLRQFAKPLGRPLPQQISVNQSSCSRSGRRRSAISLEAGGPDPPATVRPQLHSCSVFWYLASSRLHNCTMRSPSLLLDPLWEQEVEKRKITKNQTWHSDNHQAQRRTPVSVENNRPPHLTPEMQCLFLLTKKCLFPETQMGCFPVSHPWNSTAFHSMIRSIRSLCTHCNLTFCTCLPRNQRKGSLTLCCFWEVQVRSKTGLSLLGQRCQPTLQLWAMGRIFCYSHRYFKYLMQDSYVRPWIKITSLGCGALLANLACLPLETKARVVSCSGKFRAGVRDGLNSPLKQYFPLSAKVRL